MKKLIIFISLCILTACSSKHENTNTFTVGMECNYAPFNWTTLDKTDTSFKISSVDYCDGYDVVIAKKIADSLNKELVIKKIAWEGLEPALSSNEIDAIIAGMTKTEERSKNANFTSDYYESEIVMVTKKNSKFSNAKSIQDFKGAKVVAQINTIYDEMINQIDGVNHVTPLTSYPIMIVSLQSNDVDAFIAEFPVASGIVSANDDLMYIKFNSGNGFDAQTKVSIAVNKDNVELLNEIDKVLNTISIEDRNNYMLNAVNNQPSGN